MLARPLFRSSRRPAEAVKPQIAAQESVPPPEHAMRNCPTTSSLSGIMKETGGAGTRADPVRCLARRDNGLKSVMCWKAGGSAGSRRAACISRPEAKSRNCRFSRRRSNKALDHFSSAKPSGAIRARLGVLPADAGMQSAAIYLPISSCSLATARLPVAHPARESGNRSGASCGPSKMHGRNGRPYSRPRRAAPCETPRRWIAPSP